MNASDPSAAHVAVYAQYPFALERGAGARVWDSDGRAYWDLYGGHAVTVIGHAHPAVTAAVSAQCARLTFYSNVAPLAVRDAAAAELLRFADARLGGVFFCNSGAEANENALKLAIERTGRLRVAALHGGFHGRTLAALAATDSPKAHAAFGPHILPCTRLRPNALADVATIDETVAAVIVEPILSMAGVVTLEPDFLRALRQRCDDVGAWLIFDEIQTGVGRLGRPLAAGAEDVFPDLVTLAKGIANGIPMGAVLMRAAIAETIRVGDLGSTFGGGPVACAALRATLEVIERERLCAHAAAIERTVRASCRVGAVTDVIGRGALLGLRTSCPARPVQQALLERGFLTGTSGDPHVVRLLPPINTPLEAFEQLADTLRDMGAPGDATLAQPART